MSLIKRLVIKKGQYYISDLHNDLITRGIMVTRNTIRTDLQRLAKNKSFIVSVHVNGPVKGKTTMVRFATKASPAS